MCHKAWFNEKNYRCETLGWSYMHLSFPEGQVLFYMMGVLVCVLSSQAGKIPALL